MSSRRYTSADLAVLSKDLAAKLPPPVVRKKHSQEESRMQRSFIKWWHLNCRHFGVPELCLFSIPNGGARSAITGSIMKAEGARKGVPDLMLAVRRADPGNGAYGLFLELKRPTGVVSPEQTEYHRILRNQGYRVEVCWSLAECINTITQYLT